MWIFSIRFSIHFLWCWQGEFLHLSIGFQGGNLLLYSYDLKVWFSSDTVRRNLIPITLKGSKGLNTPLMITIMVYAYVEPVGKMHVKLLFISQSGIFTLQPAHQNLHKYNSALHSILLWWTHISPPLSEKTSLSDDINKVWAPSRVITTPSWTSEKYNNLLGYTHHDNIHRLYIRKSSIGLIQAII